MFWVGYLVGAVLTVVSEIVTFYVIKKRNEKKIAEKLANVLSVDKDENPDHK